MKKKLIIPAFALMVIAQWAIPVKSIIESESILTSGTAWRFRTEPIDPSDPFRGKYVTLRFNTGLIKADTVYDYGQKVYALLSTDSAGFAVVKKIYREKPETINDSIINATVNFFWRDNGNRLIQLDYSFDRFYVEESKASDAEKVYWYAQRDSTQVAYAVVKVRNGRGVIEDVMINGRPILEIVQEMNEKENRE